MEGLVSSVCVYIYIHVKIEIYVKDHVSVAYLRIIQLLLKMCYIANRAEVVNRMVKRDELVSKCEVD